MSDGGMRKWFHDRLEWHKPTSSGFDGCSVTSRCSFCGLRILQDSQGGWFLATYQGEAE